ncbi:MAG: hypothetical protein ACRDIB_03805, partial [Ardenticatenaceae bacterium]
MMQPGLWQSHPLWLRWRGPLRAAAALVSVALILFLVWTIAQGLRTTGYDLGTILRQIGWSSVGILLLLYTIALILAVWAWVNMMAHVASPLPWWDHWYIYTVTNVTRRLPGSLWHVAGRAVLYHERGASRRAIALTSALEVAFMMMSGACVL